MNLKNDQGKHMDADAVQEIYEAIQETLKQIDATIKRIVAHVEAVETGNRKNTKMANRFPFKKGKR
jgi:hypothetical protein